MKFFNIFECCLLVKGAYRSLICDTQRGQYYYIPNDLYDLLKDDLRKYDIENIKIVFGKENQFTIEKYIDFLLKNEIGFLDNKIVEELMPIDLKYEVPEEINNCIIDFSQKSNYYTQDLSGSIDYLRIKHLQIRCFDFSLSHLQNFIDALKDSTLRSIELIIPFEEKLTITLKKMILNCPKILKVNIYNSIECKIDKILSREIVYLKQNILSEKHCGMVQKSYYSINLETFTLSKNHNSCLHKKIAIDIDGNVKNCPSMSQSFGNIKDMTLEEALNQKDFKKYWNLTKDHIEICKDCEFRYICTDCRAYTERTHTNTEGLDTSKPLKCGYDPYTGEWQEWSKNPLKEKAINFYGMQDLVKK